MLDESSVEFSDNANKRCKTCDDLQYILLVVKLELFELSVLSGRASRWLGKQNKTRLTLSLV